jgi:transcriptional regulator with PAS, ATPase and Fis domain
MLIEEVQSRSPLFIDVLRVAIRVASTDANVLITGETGTGKDFIAELIHESSPRNSHPFLKIDCAAIPTSLVESELFGYEKGAFSDASQPKAGKLQLAEGGTIYLDGINHLWPAVQSKLLRFVQERTVERLGTSRVFSVDCRLISSCSAPLGACLRDGQLREDLYFRLAGVAIDMPPLRERVEDLGILVPAILAEMNEKYRKRCSLTEEANAVLRGYPWPGNIRELRNVLEQAVIHAEDAAISPVRLQLRESAAAAGFLQFAADRMMSLEDLERMYIVEVLRKSEGHLGKAAAILKINRKTLLMKRRKYGIDGR